MEQRMIMIPETQYYRMLESYDLVMEELAKTKKALAEAATSTRAE